MSIRPGRRAARLAARWLSALFFFSLLWTDAFAQPSGATVEAVEAAYLYRFAGYLEWPPTAFFDASAPIRVGVVGSEKFHEELAALVVGRSIQGRAMQVERLSSPKEAANVHMVFVGKQAWGTLDEWIAAVKGKPVAVVTDAPHGSDSGALLTFVSIDERIRFEASVRAAQQAGLRMSSRLLAVAQRVLGAGL